MLRPDTKENHFTRIQVNGDDGGMPSHQFFSPQPSGSLHLLVGIARHYADPLRREPISELKERRVDVKAVCSGSYSESDRACRIHLQIDDGARCKMLLAIGCPLDILDRKRQFVDQ